MKKNIPILVAQDGPLKGQRWALSHTLMVGRDPTCEITVLDRQVSRFHARITPTPEGVTIEDLGSKNGTNHNGTELTGACHVAGWRPAWYCARSTVLVPHI